MKKALSLLLAALLLLSGCTAPKPDKDSFVQFMQDTKLPSWLHMELASPQDIPPLNEAAWYMHGLLTFSRLYYTTTSSTPKTDEGGLVYYTQEEITPISEDLLGFNYPLLTPAEASNPDTDRIYQVILEPNEEGLNFTLDENSFGWANKHITIEASLTFVDSAKGQDFSWRVRYTFDYLPKNTTLPYRFLSSQIIDGKAPFS